MSKNLYLCTTPFQIITSILMATLFGEEADLCVDPQFMNADRILNNIEKEKVFANIYNACDSKLFSRLCRAEGLKSKILLAFALIRGKRLYCEMLSGDKHYDRIYTSSNNRMTRFLMNYILKEKWNTEVIFFDDGEGSYDDNGLLGFGRKKRSFFNRLLAKEIEDKPYKHYLYSSRYYDKTNPDSKEEIIQLPNWHNDETVSPIVERVFEAENEGPIEEKFIILDIVSNEVFTDDESRKYASIIDTIVNYLGKHNVRIKKHPRDKSDCNGVKEVSNRGIPFECLISKFADDTKVIISLTSTAVFTTKILFGKEYYILLLYKLFNCELGDERQRDLFYENMRKDYSDPSRIMIPKDEKELRSCLERLKALI